MHHSKGKGLLIELNCNLVNVLSIYLLVKEKKQRNHLTPNDSAPYAYFYFKT